MLKSGLLQTRIALIFAFQLACFSALGPAPTNAQLPATRPERTGYAETSRYDDVIEFLSAVDAASPRIHLTAFGYSCEGRRLPMLLWARSGMPALSRCSPVAGQG